LKADFFSYLRLAGVRKKGFALKKNFARTVFIVAFMSVA
jgi:hypothetical protein